MIWRLVVSLELLYLLSKLQEGCLLQMLIFLVISLSQRGKKQKQEKIQIKRRRQRKRLREGINQGEITSWYAFLIQEKIWRMNNLFGSYWFFVVLLFVQFAFWFLTRTNLFNWQSSFEKEKTTKTTKITRKNKPEFHAILNEGRVAILCSCKSTIPGR